MNVFNLVSEEAYVEQTDKIAQLLAIIAAQGDRGFKPTSWEGVQSLVRAGLASRVFSIGDQLTCQRNGENLVWDVIGIDHDIPADPQFTHSLTLQLHDCLPDTVQFDNCEAIYYAEDGLQAGTYNFTIGTSWGKATAGTYQFTLSQAVPAEGCIAGLERIADVAPQNWSISTYSDVSNTTAIETVPVTSGESGQSIGTLISAGNFDSHLNSIQRLAYGSNKYKESAIRQWLNSDAAAGSVWTPQTKFDRPPEWVASTAGFLNGIDPDFLAVIGETAITVAKNTVTDGGGSEVLRDRFFLLSKSEVYAGSENSINEGSPYPYYANYSDLSAAGIGADSNRIKFRNNIPQIWWLRTPSTTHGHFVRCLKDNGGINNYSVNRSLGVCPACNIV